MRYLMLFLLLLPAFAQANVYSVIKDVPTYIGQEADTKPVCGVAPGSVFLETDTNITYRWIGSKECGSAASWAQFGNGVSLQTNIAGENGLGHLDISLAGEGCLISSATSTECKEGAGEVVGFYVGSTSSGTITFYDDNDGTCSSNAKTGTITPAVGWHFLPLRFSTAICALTTNAINVTVIYR